MIRTDRQFAVVTGGSAGIGFELAKQFAQHGYDVAISGPSEKVYAATAQLETFGIRHSPIRQTRPRSMAWKASGLLLLGWNDRSAQPR